jgi:hypothetical protein
MIMRMWLSKLFAIVLVSPVVVAMAQTNEIVVRRDIEVPGNVKPIPVSLSWIFGRSVAGVAV